MKITSALALLLVLTSCGQDPFTDPGPWELRELWPADMAPDLPGGCQNPNTYFLDNDVDGWGTDEPENTLVSCAATPPVGYAERPGDCNDDEPRVAPDLPEACDRLDNDCSGVINDTIICDFFAHTDDTLYRIDPFQPRVTEVGEIPLLYDLDMHPDGTLHGVGPEGLFVFDEGDTSWRRTSNSAPNANGMAIDAQGRAFLSSEDLLVEIDLETGEELGTLRPGVGYESSGDVAFNGSGVIYLSSRGPESDTLWRLDTAIGVAQELGETRYRGIYALTYAWDRLYGLTLAGDLIELDPETGAGSLLWSFGSYTWYGAASTSRIRQRL